MRTGLPRLLCGGWGVDCVAVVRWRQALTRRRHRTSQEVVRRLQEVEVMPKRTRDYEASLIEALKDPDEAAAYLNAHLQRETDDPDELLLLALRHVAKAHGFG